MSVSTFLACYMVPKSFKEKTKQWCTVNRFQIVKIKMFWPLLMNLILMGEWTLSELVSKLATSYIVNWFYDEISLFFLALKHVIPYVNLNGHTCFTSLNLCCPHIWLEKIRHMWGSVLRITITMMREETFHELISKLRYSPLSILFTTEAQFSSLRFQVLRFQDTARDLNFGVGETSLASRSA